MSMMAWQIANKIVDLLNEDLYDRPLNASYADALEVDLETLTGWRTLVSDSETQWTPLSRQYQGFDVTVDVLFATRLSGPEDHITWAEAKSLVDQIAQALARASPLVLSPLDWCRLMGVRMLTHRAADWFREHRVYAALVQATYRLPRYRPRESYS